MAKNLETWRNYEKSSKDISSELFNLKSQVREENQKLETNKGPELTKEEEAEYLKLNNRYNSLLKMVSSYGDYDYRLSEEEEDIFKKQGRSFVGSVDGIALLIRSKSDDYWYTEIVSFRNEYYLSRWYWKESNKRPCIIRNGEEVELSTLQYKKVLDQFEKILKDQKLFIDNKKAKTNKKTDDMINNL